MESYLKKYKFVFNTVGPVFVGSGQNFKKKEYIFDEKKGRVKIIDVNIVVQLSRQKSKHFIMN